MKKILSVLVVILGLTLPIQVSAHSAGQIPFFKINEIYSNLYPVPTTSLSDFKLPQDDSPTIYVVNESINFELDINKLPIPPEVVKVTNFKWDFGDGEKSEGTLNAHHSYKKSGSYFLEITAQTPEISEPQLIQSVIVQVAPLKDYKLPKSIIKINGESVKDPLLDTAKVEFGKEFNLDGGASGGGSGKIVEFFWDLGNGKSTTGEKVTYQYEKDQYAFFPVLRVKDENGLIGDSFIQITNKNDQQLSSADISKLDKVQLLKIGGLTLIIGGILAILIWWYLKKRLLYKSKH